MTVYNAYDPTSLVAGSTDVIARTITIAASATVNGSATFPRGTVLGRVTNTDLYIPSVATANDGSQTPACVTADDLTIGASNVSANAYFHGEFAAQKLTYDSGWTVATLRAAFRVANEQVYIRDLNTLG